MRTVSILAACTLFAATAPAQKVGTAAPDLVWTKTFVFGEVPAKKLSELRGSVVLLEFWDTHSAAFLRRIPQLNALFAEKGEMGLVVVGVTGEDAAEVEPFVTKNKMEYPVGIADTEDYDVVGFPDAVLIDKDGKIVWRGHPASLDKKLVDTTLAGAKAWVAARGLEDVAALRKAGDHGGAWRKAGELLAEGKLSDRAQAMAKEWVAGAEKFVVDSLAAATQAEAAKDVYLQWCKLDPIANGYQGVPGAEEGKVRLDKLLAESRNKKEIEAGKLVTTAKAHEAAMEFDKAYEILKDVSTKLGTTKAGKVATTAYRALEKDGKLGYDAACSYCKAGGVACPSHRKKKR